MKTLETIDLQWKDYAKVPTRIKEFRSDCPNGLIETIPTILNDWKILFKARIVKDKSDPNSAEWTWHSMWMSKTAKDFEKLETISVGRALAMLWYLASWEVASSEEMEEFMEYQKTKQEEEMDLLYQELESIDDVELLRQFYKKNSGKWKEFEKAIMEKSVFLKSRKNENS